MGLKDMFGDRSKGDDRMRSISKVIPHGSLGRAKIPNFYDSDATSVNCSTEQENTTENTENLIETNNTDTEHNYQSPIRVQLAKKISDQSTCILDREAIRKRIQGGHIFIHPYSEESLRKCHVALTLGDSYFTQHREVAYITPTDEVELRKLWNGPFSASEFNSGGHKGKYIIVEPQSTVLVHTKETLGVYYSVCASFNLCPKIILCGMSAQISMFYVGNIDKVTVLLTNNSYNRVTLPVGTVFLYCTFMLTNYTADTGLSERDSLEFSRSWQFIDIFPNVKSNAQMYSKDVQTVNIKEFTGFGKKDRKMKK